MSTKSLYKKLGILFIVGGIVGILVSFATMDINGAIGGSIISGAIGGGLAMALLIRSSQMCIHQSWGKCDMCLAVERSRKDQ